MRKRNIKKQIWLDIKEDELLKRKSKEAGLSEAEFIRSLIIHLLLYLTIFVFLYFFFS